MPLGTVGTQSKHGSPAPGKSHSTFHSLRHAAKDEDAHDAFPWHTHDLQDVWKELNTGRCF
eukprot:1960038-Amphidinium_carterae.1